MFVQHEQILRDVFTRVAGDSAVISQRVAQLQQGHLEAAQVVSTVAAGIDERVVADATLRQELVEFAGKLQAS